MEYKPLAELQVKEDVSFLEKQTPMTREQRLERWIELLQRNAGRRLRSLQEIEYLSAASRRACRADDLPLAVAYADPVLRTAGLRSDRVGDCMDFFDLTDKQMHHAFCSCHVGAKLTASEAAKRLRHVVLGNLLRRKMTSALSTIRHIFRAA